MAASTITSFEAPPHINDDLGDIEWLIDWCEDRQRHGAMQADNLKRQSLRVA